MDNHESWKEEFDARQVNEIEFARIYADQFHHGTDGHNRLLLIAQMANKLDALQQQVNDASS